MNEVRIFLKKLLKKNDIIIVAISGGPDSMCLLHLLCELKSELSLTIVVAHVNHKLRTESEEERAFVESFAKANDVYYEYMEITEYNHDNLENEARVKRYEFFQELVIKYQAHYLMTAHHGDDLTETILMRLVRGSSLKGYSGFRKIIDMDSYKLVRPLITLTKEEIIKYLDTNNYKYYIDKSNYSKEYTRNRYRLEVLPFLKKENPLVHLKFLKFSEELNKANDFIIGYIKKIIPNIKCESGYFISKLKELDSYLLEKVIENELRLYYVNDLFLISDKNKEDIIKLINSPKSNGKVNLPNGYIAVKDYDILKIVHHINTQGYSYLLEDYVNVPQGVIKRVVKSDKKNNFVIRLNSQDIKLPLIVRSRKDGDKMAVKNLGGTKKIKDILIDEKIPITKRSTIPVVSDSNNVIVWLPGIKKSKFDMESNEIYDIILSYEEERL